jgi:hypothetical protein
MNRPSTFRIDFGDVHFLPDVFVFEKVVAPYQSKPIQTKPSGSIPGKNGILPGNNRIFPGLSGMNGIKHLRAFLRFSVKKSEVFAGVHWENTFVLGKVNKSMKFLHGRMPCLGRKDKKNMMSLETIRQVSNEACAKAAKKNKRPLIIEAEDIEAAGRGDFSGIQIPFLGGFCHPKFRETGRGWTVNKFSSSSAIYFATQCIPGKAYAMTEEGQFQVYVQEYEKIGAKSETTL